MVKRYSEQFKASAIEQVLKKSAHQTVKSIALALGIGNSTLEHWLKGHRDKQGKQNNQSNNESKRIAALEADNKHLREVNDILKKAAAYFATHQK
jgi:transposase